MNIRQIIMDYLQDSPKKSLSVEELSIELHLNKAGDFKLFVKTLASLEAEHLIRFTTKGKIELEQAKALLTGIFHAHANGFGFVTVDGEEADIFIGKGKTLFALEGDEVKIEVTKNANILTNTAAEGIVEKVLSHDLHQIVGTFKAFNEEEKTDSGLLGYVKSRNKKIPYRLYLTSEGLIPADRDIVRAEITHYPENDFPQSMQGVVTEIIGKESDTGIDVLEVLASMDIHSDFPEEVLAQTRAIPAGVKSMDLFKRTDYRDEITFTIDGADAKDLDDAVHAKRLSNGNFELGVHIADVSYYVTENSPLDKEAFERGTSVYVTDRVVPMLPERLSNGICSLNPRVNRLTQSCVMEISPVGKIVHYRISQSVIKTTERMTYDDVNRMIAGDETALEQFSTIAHSVEIMVELHKILENMRRKRGAIDFETVEAKIIVNEKGFPVEIRKRERGIAERMIESFMLAANETVATDFEKRGLPFIYRIHEQPKADRLARFIDFASTFGLQVQGTSSEISQSAMQDFLRKIKGEPYEMVLSTMLLRSMQQARYSEHNAGHFGLAAENYTHFTSPIRRYPDLLVHRLIRALDNPSEKTIEKWQEKIPEIAQQSSNRERRAVDAEREVEKMKKAEFMERFVDEEYDGVVSSVTRFGMFVELENTVEGLIHISSIKGDYFAFQERALALVGERTGLIFKIGQSIRIKVAKADKITGEVDFEYIPSDFDVIEKTAKVKRKPEKQGHSSAKSSDKSGKFDKNHKSSGHFDRNKKPYPAGKGRFDKKKSDSDRFVKSEKADGKRFDKKKGTSDGTAKSDFKKFDKKKEGYKGHKNGGKPYAARSGKPKFADGRKKAHKQFD